eukprot:3143868-Alexandrium_andersonii.AAC.1
MPARTANPARNPSSASLASPSEDTFGHRAVITLRAENTKVSALLLPLERLDTPQRPSSPSNPLLAARHEPRGVVGDLHAR